MFQQHMYHCELRVVHCYFLNPISALVLYSLALYWWKIDTVLYELFRKSRTKWKLRWENFGLDFFGTQKVNTYTRKVMHGVKNFCSTFFLVWTFWKWSDFDWITRLSRHVFPFFDLQKKQSFPTMKNASSQQFFGW